MTLLKNLLKAVMPIKVRQFLRNTHRNIVFRRAMKKFMKNPETFKNPAHPVILDLIYGWGNESRSGLGELLVGCIQHSLTTHGPTLECGSGLSTLLIGTIAKKQGYVHWALEHKPEWAARVQKYLDRYKIDSVNLSEKSLKDYGDYCWYDVALESMPDHFSLVVCDGPPGDTKGGRYGLVPVMRKRLQPGCIIILDDAARNEEQSIADSWKKELKATYKIQGSKNPYFEMKIPL